MNSKYAWPGSVRKLLAHARIAYTLSHGNENSELKFLVKWKLSIID
jgi:DNA-binding NtrC family response regulator